MLNILALTAVSAAAATGLLLAVTSGLSGIYIMCAIIIVGLATVILDR